MRVTIGPVLMCQQEPAHGYDGEPAVKGVLLHQPLHPFMEGSFDPLVVRRGSFWWCCFALLRWLWCVFCAAAFFVLLIRRRCRWFVRLVSCRSRSCCLCRPYPVEVIFTPYVIPFSEHVRRYTLPRPQHRVVPIVFLPFSGNLSAECVAPLCHIRGLGTGHSVQFNLSTHHVLGIACLPNS